MVAAANCKMITANVAGSTGGGGSGKPPPSFHANRTHHLTPGARAWVRSHSQLNIDGGRYCLKHCHFMFEMKKSLRVHSVTCILSVV